jgi:hypothetical protein
MTLNADTVALVVDLVERGKANRPELAARLERAFRIVCFRPIERLPHGWAVPSESGEGAYAVTSEHHCSCPDAANRAPGGWCKHALAVLLVERVEAAEAADTAALLAHFSPSAA